jgi:hypothetical protein
MGFFSNSITTNNIETKFFDVPESRLPDMRSQVASIGATMREYAPAMLIRPPTKDVIVTFQKKSDCLVFSFMW